MNRRRSNRIGAAGVVRSHLAFVVVLAAAAVLRGAAWLAIYPGWWIIGDSIGYIQVALTHHPERWRPGGYSVLVLLPLLPLHDLSVVTALQHLMGLAVGVLVYATLLRLGLPRWAALLASLPALFDSFLLGNEQMLASDTLFTALVTAALAVLLWRFERPTLLAVAAAGLLLGLATTTRIVGLPLIAVPVVVLLVRRVGWQRLGALVAAFVLPLGAYALWFSHTYGELNLTASSGLFLYGRTTQFVVCDRVPFATDQLRSLCPVEPVGHRNEAFYVFDVDAPITLQHLDPVASNALADQFAIAAIRAQPADYAVEVLDGVWQTFQWDLGAQPIDSRFLANELMTPDGTAAGIAYQGHDPGPFYQPRLLAMLEAYQNVFWVRGTLFLGVLVVVAAGLLLGRDEPGRGLRAALLLTAGTAAVLLMVPAATAVVQPRYRIPAIPAACLAAALAGALVVNRARAALPAGAGALSGPGHPADAQDLPA